MSKIDTAKEREKLAGLAGFTPGPWKDWQPRSDESVPVRTDGLGITIAYIHQGAVTNARNNARLIAAAPELKATLAAALDALDAKDAEIERLREALSAMLDLQDNASPFGGEMYQDRVGRVFDQCRAALKGSDQ